jgi:hypothetical protein
MSVFNDFLGQLEIDQNIFLIVGGILLLIGVFKIIQNGITIVFWAFLSLIGLVGVQYGLDSETIILPGNLTEEVLKAIKPGTDISIEALESMFSNLKIATDSQNR